MSKRLDLKEILSELASTVGRASLLGHIDNLDGNIDATPEPPEPGEAELIAQQIADLQRRAAEIAPADTPEGGN